MSSNNYEKPDFWSRKAFSEGYPARSVYKLREIDEKFRLIPKNCRALDLGAAPGSWTIFLLRRFNGDGHVVSCDLNPLSKCVKGENLTFIQGDLNDESVRGQIEALGPYDLVVCDAAPLTTGNRTVDTARSQQLVEMAVWYAENMLRKGGNFTVKIFQNGDQQLLLKKMHDLFSTAKGFKPEACRTESFETYLVGIGRK
jgi:23S rRNA (uridine2552-2'-O)-methyltransferase